MTLHLLVPDPEPLAPALTKRYTCTGCDTRIETGLEAVNRLHPDVVLFCFSTPGDVSWETAMRTLRSAGAEVVVLSEWPTFAYEAFRLEAAGFALWPADMDEIGEVLSRVEQRVLEKSILRNSGLSPE
jgi:DNA-binding NarL/FixJ family response regulator